MNTDRYFRNTCSSTVCLDLTGEENSAWSVEDPCATVVPIPDLAETIDGGNCKEPFVWCTSTFLSSRWRRFRRLAAFGGSSMETCCGPHPHQCENKHPWCPPPHRSMYPGVSGSSTCVSFHPVVDHVVVYHWCSRHIHMELSSRHVVELASMYLGRVWWYPRRSSSSRNVMFQVWHFRPVLVITNQ